MKRFIIAASIVMALFVFVGMPTSVEAGHINCGDVLGPGGSFTLDSDLFCSSSTPVALTVDSAKLDMHGHKITCTGIGQTGLRIQGLGSKVKKGLVTACEVGVVILDLPLGGPNGRHFIQKLTATANTFIGFDIGAHDNVVTGSSAAGNLQGGFVIRMEDNLLISNGAANNGGVGGFIVEGNFNTLIGNRTLANDLDGIFIQAANNQVRNNTVTGNGRSGIRIINPVSQNNEVTHNLVNTNFEGIRVFLDSTFNTIESNTAQNSTTTDLIDDNPNCDNNIWKNNTFVTDEVVGASDGGSGVGCIQ